MSSKKIKKRNLSDKEEMAFFNQSKRAEYTLDEILNEASPEEIIERELSHAPVEEEKKGQKIIQRDTKREMSRVLFITKDTAYLERESKAMSVIFNLGGLFDEIHIMVLMTGIGNDKSERVTDNIWTYSVHAKNWWFLPRTALDRAEEQLAFGSGFRPDVVVALDPFEAGLAALKIARKFDRSFQVHVYQDFLNPAFLESDKANKWRRRIAKYVLKRTKSIRVGTQQIQSSLQHWNKKLTEVVLLPKFYNFKAFMQATPSFDVHDKYKDFIFIALAFGPLTADSHLHDIFSALNRILHNPRIGLVVVGSGPAKKLFSEKVELLGIKKNVVFLPQVADLTSYLKTSDVLIQTDTSSASEEIVLQAAAAGLPLIMYETDIRKDLFKDGESAALCEPKDIHAISKKLTDLLNDVGLRIRYKKSAKNMVETRLVEDEATYYRAYRDSIELALVKNTNHKNKEKGS